MDTKINIRKFLVDIIAGLYTLLFVYAATSKLFDFENFQVELGQSPVLGVFAGALSWLVPLLEIIISIGLWLTRFRLAALFCCYTLMLMFTGYIFIILNYSSFIPCSCGGVLEKMSWTVHMYFNLLFVALAGVAIFLTPKIVNCHRNPAAKILAFCTIGSLGLMFALNQLTNTVIHEHNTFLRRYPYSAELIEQNDLKFNSFYIAGISRNKLYLGNYTTPLALSELNENLERIKRHLIQLDTLLPHSSPHIRIDDDYFHVTDGNIPIIYQGNMDGKWMAKKVWQGELLFTQVQFPDLSTIALRGIGKDGKMVLATLNTRTYEVKPQPSLLQGHIDGFFDVDGTLLLDRKTNDLSYVHYYKNELILADKDMNLKQRNKTIDTVSKAAIKVAKLKKSGDRLLAAPPLTVNHGAAVDNGYLYVHSALVGRHESKTMWQQASVIDIYQTSENRYIASFYVYHIDGKKLKSFIVKNSMLYGLIGDHIVAYKIPEQLYRSKK